MRTNTGTRQGEDLAELYVVDDGRYGILIASSAADSDIQAQRLVTVHGRLLPVPHVVTAKPVAAGDAAYGIRRG